MPRSSVHARGDNRPDSDIIVDLDLYFIADVYGYVGLKNYIASLFDDPVDVVHRGGLKSFVRRSATADVILAF